MDCVTQGDLVTVATSGDYGKPRPTLIVQSDVYASPHDLSKTAR